MAALPVSLRERAAAIVVQSSAEIPAVVRAIGRLRSKPIGKQPKKVK